MNWIGLVAGTAMLVLTGLGNVMVIKGFSAVKSVLGCNFEKFGLSRPVGPRQSFSSFQLPLKIGLYWSNGLRILFLRYET